MLQEGNIYDLCRIQEGRWLQLLLLEAVSGNGMPPQSGYDLSFDFRLHVTHSGQSPNLHIPMHGFA